MTKQIQINKELFDDLIYYFWSEDFLRGWFADGIRRKLNSKTRQNDFMGIVFSIQMFVYRRGT